MRGLFGIHFGPIASGDEAIFESKRAREVHERTGALAVAWEGAGGARAARFSDVPYLEIRGISDKADQEAPEVWMENLPSAIHNVAVVIDSLADTLDPEAKVRSQCLHYEFVVLCRQIIQPRLLPAAKPHPREGEKQVLLMSPCSRFAQRPSLKSDLQGALQIVSTRPSPVSTITSAPHYEAAPECAVWPSRIAVATSRVPEVSYPMSVDVFEL